jgi:hypothetical protein
VSAATAPKLRPSRDPNAGHLWPGRTFIHGAWQTPAQAERERERWRAKLQDPELRARRNKRDRERTRERRARGADYGLTSEQAETIDLRAGGACEGCGSADRLTWDHDHETDEVRGRLCHGCNVALGATGDDHDPDGDRLDTRGRLLALVRYLDRHEARSTSKAASC